MTKNVTSWKTISNNDNKAAGKPVAVFRMTETIGLLKFRMVWIKYLAKKPKQKINIDL